MKVYLDYAASTPMSKEVISEIERNYNFFGNPSSPHSFGEKANEILESSRKKIAQVLKVKPGEIFFTSSGTESINLAVFGVARANKKTGKRIIVSNIEHLAVLNSCKKLEREGFKVIYVKAKKDGIVMPQDVEEHLARDTILVSIMHANNEIGTIQPIREIGNIISKFREKNSLSYPYFHTDACQTAGALNIRPHDLGVDLLTLNGSKIYGPKGTGCLFVRRGIKIEPIIFGGSQEKGVRAGTENVALISGLAKALEVVQNSREKNSERESGLRDYCIKKILTLIPDSKLNGHPKKRLPNNMNFSFKGIDGEMLVLALSEKEIMVSTGSACTTSETGPSHVIEAIDVPDGWENIRATLGNQTTKKEIDYFIDKIKRTVKQLRNLS